MNSHKLIGIALLITTLLAACAAPTRPGTQTNSTSPGSQSTAMPLPSMPASTGVVTVQPIFTPSAKDSDIKPAFIPAVQKFAADKLGVKAEDVKILKIEQVDWPDACLGAGRPDEMCAQVITPGYRIQVEVKGITYQFHTNSGGTVIRQASPAASGVSSSPAGEAARKFLADRLKVDLGLVKVSNITEVTWPDGCLGVQKPNAACTMALVPGYKVILEVLGASYEVHTNQDGKQIVLAEGGLSTSGVMVPGINNAQLTWKSGDKACVSLQVSGNLAAYGPCGSSLKVIPMKNADRSIELAAFVKAYRSFTAKTTAGEVTFNGSGANEASPAQQRALAEWGQMVYLEVSTSAVTANIGLALSWHREGGIAGFCDNLKVYRSGLVTTSSCKSGIEKPLSSRWLSTAQLDMLFGWLDNLQTFDGKQTDTAVADSMKIAWVLSGTGSRMPTEAEKQAIQDFAALLFSEK